MCRESYNQKRTRMISSAEKNKDDIIRDQELEACYFRLLIFIKPNKLQSSKQKQTNKTMKKLFLSFLMMLAMLPLAAANKYDNPDTLVVSRDGTGEFRTIDEAIQVCRAFME